MKKSYLALMITASLTAGCATIFNGSNKPVSIQTNPVGAEFTITNRDGHVISSGHTPQQVTLNNGSGYFKKGIYKIKVSKAGYEDASADLTPSLTGWYWGNILLGGLLGMVIVDPATGSMYKLPDETLIPMRKLEGSDIASTDSIESRDNRVAEKTSSKWQFQAEKLAQASSCSQPSLASIGPGFELYTSNCNDSPASIRCEFGHCAIQ